MARPAGEIRMMLFEALRELCPTRAELVTQRDVAAKLIPRGVGRTAIRRTHEELVRSGRLAPVGSKRVPDSCRPLTLYRYVPDEERAQRELPGLALQAAYGMHAEACAA